MVDLLPLNHCDNDDLSSNTVRYMAVRLMTSYLEDDGDLDDAC